LTPRRIGANMAGKRHRKESPMRLLLALCCAALLLAACRPEVVVVVVTPTPEPVPTITPTTSTAYVVPGTEALESPSALAQPQCTLSGQRVNVVGTHGDWKMVADGQCEGYVFGRYLLSRPR
jgi:hypothetical protein